MCRKVLTMCVRVFTYGGLSFYGFLWVSGEGFAPLLLGCPCMLERVWRYMYCFWAEIEIICLRQCYLFSTVCQKKNEFPHKKEPVTVGDSAVVRVVLISSGRSSVGAFLPFCLRLQICADPAANLVIWPARLLNRGHTHQPEDNSLHTLCRPSPWQEHWKFSPGSAPLALDFS